MGAKLTECWETSVAWESTGCEVKKIIAAEACCSQQLILRWQLYLHVKRNVSYHSNQKFHINPFQIHVLKCCDCSWWISEETTDVEILWAKWQLSRILFCIKCSRCGPGRGIALCSWDKISLFRALSQWGWSKKGAGDECGLGEKRRGPPSPFLFRIPLVANPTRWSLILLIADPAHCWSCSSPARFYDCPHSRRVCNRLDKIAPNIDTCL